MSLLNVLLIGLPDTGKTTYLAALQYTLDNPELYSKWRHSKYGSNTEYLNRIEDFWVKCEQQDRTTRDSSSLSNDNDIFIVHSETNDDVVLNIPDLKGETYSQQWRTRSWDESYFHLVERAQGILLFIKPDKIKLPVQLSTMATLAPLIDNVKRVETSTKWSVDSTPTQVIYVELLQFHRNWMLNRPIPVSIIISAWDKVMGQSEDISPDGWLEESMPLLWQFINSNPDSFKYVTYGVSAQGGDYNDSKDIERLLTLNSPTEKIIVVTDIDKGHDIQSPINWIYNQWKHK